LCRMKRTAFWWHSHRFISLVTHIFLILVGTHHFLFLRQMFPTPNQILGRRSLVHPIHCAVAIRNVSVVAHVGRK
jgi:hypothetical protein